MRKFLSVLLAMVMVLSLMVPTAFAAEEDITILYTNDVHTYIDNEEKVGEDADGNNIMEPRIRYSVVAALKKSLGDNVLLVDAGDHIQGTAYGSMDKGETIIDLMNATGYDLATLGNHEFDYGQEGRINATDEWADFPYVSCNFLDKDGNPVLDAYKVFEIGGKKIAFVGITTPESFTKSTPAYFQDEDGNYIYDILGGADGAELYAAVQAAIDAAAAEADMVIGLGHLGDDTASQPWTSEEVIANTTGLDAFIDGHSHSTVAGKEVADKNGDPVLLTQTGEYLGAVGKMVIKTDGTITTALLTYDDLATLTPDAEVKAIEEEWISDVNDLLGEVIGHTDLTFDNYERPDADTKIRLVRKMETNTGDFAADALYYLFDSSLDMDVDVAIMNGGGVRNEAVTGDISYLTCKSIHTFGNVACLQTVTGQQLLDALEWGAKDGPDAENGGFLHVSGITYDIDFYTPSTVQKDDVGVWTGGPTGDYRVYNVKVYNKETQAYEDLDLEAKYNLAGYNYTLRDLGDGFAMFDGAVNVLDYVMEDYMVLANYVKGFSKGEVKAANSPLLKKYPNLVMDYSTVYGSGRINGQGNLELTVTKEWEKDEAKDRPSSVKVTIKRDGESFRTLTLKASNDWTATAVLPMYNSDGAAYEYTYVEKEVEGYKSEQDLEILDFALEFVYVEEDEETFSTKLEQSDLMMLIGLDKADMDAIEPNNVTMYVWCADEDYGDLLYDELVAELGEEYEDLLKVISGEDALKELGTCDDGVWAFDVDFDDDELASGVVALVGYNLVPAAAELTITNTKEAPPTGDNGVALYVGLAIMAALGTAVVVGKKKEIF